MKKLVSILLVSAVLFSLSPAFAQGKDPVDLSKAVSALIIDADSGKVLIEKNSDKKVQAAGLKRLPALLTICKAFDDGIIKEDTIVSVCPEAAGIKGPTAFLSANETIDAGQLLKAAVMLTAGDALYALLRNIFGTEQASLKAVNETLDTIGAERLSGDSMGGEASFSATELAKISLELSKSEAFLKYSSVYIDTLTHENAKATELTNPNRLVRFYTGCFGLATGSVGASEYAGSFIARRGDTCFLCVVLGIPDSASRFDLARDLFDWAFSTFRTVRIGKNDEILGSVRIKGGKVKETEVYTDCKASVLLPIGDAKIKTEAMIPDEVEAPLDAGAVVGTLMIYNSAGELIGEIPIKTKNTVEKAVFRDYFRDMILSWLRIAS